MTTMNDIAKALGVSRPVVSSVFSTRRQGTVRVSNQTRKKILEKAREMGYRPNDIARSVATGKTRVIAFVGGNMKLDFAMETLSGVMLEAERRGYVVKVMQSTEQGWTIPQMVDTLLGRRVDGAIFFHMDQLVWDQINRELRGAIPAVALSCVASQGSLVSINSDNEQAYEHVFDHLIELGHRRIAMIGGIKTTINERSADFETVARRRGLFSEFGLIGQGDWEIQKAEILSRNWLSRPADQRPTAICCGNDEMAMGVLRTARQMGFDVPSQLSVVGFGDTHVAPMADPPLTSVNQSYDTMGQLAGQQLIDALEAGKQAKPQTMTVPQLTVPTELIVRKSTAVASNS